MENKLERLIKIVYKKWKSDYLSTDQFHPDEENMACFLEGRLSPQENSQIKLHLLNCDSCAEAFATQLRIKETRKFEVPEELLIRVKNLVKQRERGALLEVILRLKGSILELVNTTGDVLVGEELMPIPVLRSRQIKDFKDKITILKNFQDITVELKIENKKTEAFSLTVMIKEKMTQKIMKDLRVALIKDELELESYVVDSGRVTFEHVLLGKYIVEISAINDKLASISLDIKT